MSGELQLTEVNLMTLGHHHPPPLGDHSIPLSLSSQTTWWGEVFRARINVLGSLNRTKVKESEANLCLVSFPKEIFNCTQTERNNCTTFVSFVFFEADSQSCITIANFLLKFKTFSTLYVIICLAQLNLYLIVSFHWHVCPDVQWEHCVGSVAVLVRRVTPKNKT